MITVRKATKKLLQENKFPKLSSTILQSKKQKILQIYFMIKTEGRCILFPLSFPSH